MTRPDERARLKLEPAEHFEDTAEWAMHFPDRSRRPTTLQVPSEDALPRRWRHVQRFEQLIYLVLVDLDV